MKRKLFILLAMVLTACGGGTSDNNRLQNVGDNLAPALARTSVAFDPKSTSLKFPLPLPTDLARSAATGLNAIPGTGEPFDAMNSMAGFSTSGPIFIPLTGQVRPTSVDNQSIIVLDATDGLQPCTFEVGEGDAGNGSLVIANPVKPLKSERRILVIVTDKVFDVNGLALGSSFTIRQLKDRSPLVGSTLLSAEDAAALEPVRQTYQPLWQQAETFLGRSRDDIPFVFGFTTQRLSATLPAIRSRIQGETPTPAFTREFVDEASVLDFMSTNPIGRQVLTEQSDFAQVVGAVRYGTIPATQYLANANTANERPFDESLTSQGILNVEFLLCTPNPQTFPGERPVVVYQHGFTRTKDDLLAISRDVCGQGFALIGIDAVRHGNQTEPGLDPNAPPGGSGTGFVNLANLRLFRDYIRQTSANQMTLVRAITRGAFPSQLASNPPLFVGTSLGGIIGGVTLAVEPNLPRGLLNAAGGRLTRLALDSQTFRTIVVDGLAAQGLAENSPEFRQFFWIAQTVLDDADPVNYRPSGEVLLQEMIGDTVVPNSCTTDLALALNLPQVNAKQAILVTAPGFGDFTLSQVAAPISGSGLFQESGGDHGFLIDPAQGGPDGSITVHAQDQMRAFLFGDTILPRGQAGRSFGITQSQDYTGLIRLW